MQEKREDRICKEDLYESIADTKRAVGGSKRDLSGGISEAGAQTVFFSAAWRKAREGTAADCSVGGSGSGLYGGHSVRKHGDGRLSCRIGKDPQQGYGQ